jgi:proteasome beta subunit
VRFDPFAPGFGSSFYDYLAHNRRDLLPAAPSLVPGAAPPLGSVAPGALPPVSHGTTVLALRFEGGVVIAGDRMASDGHTVSSRRIDKVIPTDTFSAMAISGAVGPCLEMAKLFSTELEFYEKIEGRALSLSGKANKLAQMVRGNLPLAMQGLAVIPLFAGYDTEARAGRIFKYDVAGGRTEEAEYAAAGSGTMQAKGSLKKTFRPAMPEADAVRVALGALRDAADDDLGTGGADPDRGIWPSVVIITESGMRHLPEADVAGIHRALDPNGGKE